MNTDRLIVALAQGLEPTNPRLPVRALVLAVVVGTAISLALASTALGKELVLPAFGSEPMFWVKVAFGVGLAAASLRAVARLGRPGTRLSAAAVLPFVPLAVVWALAAVVLLGAPAQMRTELILGRTWSTCPGTIAVLSVPTLIGSLLALRAMAPTRPMWAGAAAGALAGGLGATVYSLQCPELAAPFLAVWYVLGVSIPVAVGMLLGRFTLRW